MQRRHLQQLIALLLCGAMAHAVQAQGEPHISCLCLLSVMTAVEHPVDHAQCTAPGLSNGLVLVFLRFMGADFTPGPAAHVMPSCGCSTLLLQNKQLLVMLWALSTAPSGIHDGLAGLSCGPPSQIQQIGKDAEAA